jgi:hypothetical protein
MQWTVNTAERRYRRDTSRTAISPASSRMRAAVNGAAALWIPEAAIAVPSVAGPRPIIDAGSLTSGNHRQPSLNGSRVVYANAAVRSAAKFFGDYNRTMKFAMTVLLPKPKPANGGNNAAKLSNVRRAATRCQATPLLFSPLPLQRCCRASQTPGRYAPGQAEQGLWVVPCEVYQPTCSPKVLQPGMPVGREQLSAVLGNASYRLPTSTENHRQDCRQHQTKQVRGPQWTQSQPMS